MAANENGCLGVFDSGVGGLSVVRAMLRALPHESLLYVADNFNCPYGAKPPAEITRLSLGISRFLLAQGAKAIVVACNTASAAALAHLRQALPDVPFIGMVPAVKPAAQRTRSGVVGVLATPGTLHGKLYEDVVNQFAMNVQVEAVACPGLVEMIEAGEVEGERAETLLRTCIDPLVDAGADTLVLGCTHYPFVIPVIQRLYGTALQVLEPSDAVARQVQHVLTEHGLLLQADTPGSQAYFSTGNKTLLERALSRFIKGTGSVCQLYWQADVLLGGTNANPG